METLHEPGGVVKKIIGPEKAKQSDLDRKCQSVFDAAKSRKEKEAASRLANAESRQSEIGRILGDLHDQNQLLADQQAAILRVCDPHSLDELSMVRQRRTEIRARIEDAVALQKLIRDMVHEARQAASPEFVRNAAEQEALHTRLMAS